MRSMHGGGGGLALPGLLVGLLAAGCAAPVPLPHQNNSAQPAVTAFDGRYAGSLTVTGAATGLDPRDCTRPTALDFEVREGRFTLTLQPPRTAITSPDLRASATVVYDASIAANGTVGGVSDTTNTHLVGQVNGTRMTGQIYGLLCYYSLSAERR